MLMLLEIDLLQISLVKQVLAAARKETFLLLLLILLLEVAKLYFLLFSHPLQCTWMSYALVVHH